MNQKVNVASYASELLFHASVSEPWSVSEDTFISVVALLSDGTELTAGEREDVIAFFQLASEYAEAAATRPQAGVPTWSRRASRTVMSSVMQVYRDACREARARGRRVHGDRVAAL